MASKIRVEELRSILSIRGLDTRGTKAMLVKRLEDATRSEDEKGKEACVDESAPSSDDILNDGGKRNFIESDLKVDELRLELSLRGLDTRGTKSVLVKRLEEAMRVEDKAGVDELAPISDKAGADGATPSLDGVSKECGKRKRSSIEPDLKVDELRSMLSLRGLDTRGTKPMLIKRLEEAMQGEDEKEKKPGADEAVPNSDKTGIDEGTPFSDDVSNDRGKRKRSFIEPDDGSKEEEYLDEGRLKKYPVRELKALAMQCGVSASGTMGELVKRLTGVAKIQKVTVQEEEPEKIEKENFVLATKKGAAVLDIWLPDDIKSSYHVLQKGEDIYDATLNQTNVGKNINKFYVIQALESDSEFKYMVYFRCGRVGEKGQYKLQGPLTEEKAIAEFQYEFYYKTRNKWVFRNRFVSYPKFYTWLEMDYMEAGQEQMPSRTIKSVDDYIRETKLDGRVVEFISLICNVTMMKQHMLEIGYNAEKLPLGKLSQSTILKGYDVLKRISDVIGQGDRTILEQLSGEFYTVIPHDFGFKKMREFVIDTSYKLKVKLEMISALGEIETATKILKNDADSLEDPLCSFYQRLCCELTPVHVDSNEFSMVEKYIKNTHTEQWHYTVDLVHLFRVSRKGEDERFKQFSNVKNRMLLWHGSQLINWTDILSQGLRIAPPEASASGYMFREGIYFSDTFRQSSRYCFPLVNSSAAALLLCEVALGDMSELFSLNYHTDLLPEGKLSIKGVGATAPDLLKAEKLEDGVVVPLGKLKENDSLETTLLYNEYIVYNSDQVRIRYLVQFNFANKIITSSGVQLPLPSPF